jgi:imidazolonepropionase-like amidohydrolase
MYDATLITGDGSTILPNNTMIIEEGIISEICNFRFPPYIRGDKVIDAGGGYVIPGVINHHTHGVTLGPFLPFPEPPLTSTNVLHNLDRHLEQGTTTVCGLCGFETIEEMELSNKLHPINVKTGTLHTPLTFDWAKLIGSALEDRHMNVTAEQMKEYGAVAIGESIPVRNITKVRRELGIEAPVHDIRNLIRVVQKSISKESRCLREVEEVLKKAGLRKKINAEKVVGVIRANVIEPGELKARCFREQIDTAKRLKLPIVVHHSSENSSLLLEAAPEIGDQMIAAHSNYIENDDIETRTTLLKELKSHGVIIDIASGDAFSAKQQTPKPDATFSCIARGLVDVISTDYAMGYWDSILLVLEKAVEQKVIDLPGAVALATGNVVKALPRIAYNRGFLEVGRVADLVLLGKDSLSEVRTVVIGGRIIIEDGRRIHDTTLPA